MVPFRTDRPCQSIKILKKYMKIAKCRFNDRSEIGRGELYFNIGHDCIESTTHFSVFRIDDSFLLIFVLHSPASQSKKERTNRQDSKNSS